jgi:CRP-like cAMP-binding protein
MLASETLARASGHPSPVPLDPLFSGAVPLRLGHDELLYLPEEESRQAYLIVEGEIRLYKINAEGREFTLGIFGPGEIVGESELLTDSKRACYAVARGAAHLLALEKRAFLQHLRESPGEALRLARFISLKNQVIERKMESLLFKSAHAKVAEQLLALAEQHSRPADARNGKTLLAIDYPITHQEIANLIGATRETVSYVLLDFKAMELIETGRRRIAIRDLSGLKELARA